MRMSLCSYNQLLEIHIKLHYSTKNLNHIGHWKFTLFFQNFGLGLALKLSPLALLHKSEFLLHKTCTKICQLLGEFMNQTIHNKNLIFPSPIYLVAAGFGAWKWAPNFAQFPCSMHQAKPEYANSKTPLNFQIFRFPFYLHTLGCTNQNRSSKFSKLLGWGPRLNVSILT